MAIARAIHNNENPYIKISNNLFDYGLSAKACGILTYLLSRPDHWEPNVNHLCKVFKDGKASIQSGLKELQRSGFLVRIAVKDALCRIVDWRVIVYEDPVKENLPKGTDYKRDSKGNYHKYLRFVDPDSEYEDLDERSTGKRKQKEASAQTFTKTELPPDPENRIVDAVSQYLGGNERIRVSASDNVVPFFPDSDFRDLGNPVLENQAQIITNTAITKFIRNSPPTPPQVSQGQRRGQDSEKQNGDRQSEINQGKSNSLRCQTNQDLSSQPNTQARVNVPPAQVKVVPVTTSRLVKADPFFGKFRGGSAYASALANPYPPGVWLVENRGRIKIDPAFLEWVGEWYAHDYGHDTAKARRNARASWKNNPAKIADDWDYYHDWYVQRVATSAVKQENGGAIADEERAKLELHQRAAVDSDGEMTMPPETRALLKNFKRKPEEILGMWAEKLAVTASKPEEFVQEELNSAELPVETDWDAIAKQAQKEEQEYLSQDTYTPPQATAIGTANDSSSRTTLEPSIASESQEIKPSTPAPEFVAQVKALKAQREAQQRAKAQAIAEADGELTPDKLYRLNTQLVNSKLRKDPLTQARAERFAASDGFCCDRDQDGLICEIWEASCF